VPLRIISGTSFWLILDFTGLGHHSHTTGDTAKNSLNEPLGNITVTFFGKIQDVPINFLMGTSWSHDLEHCKCTSHFLGWGIAGKIVGKFLDVPGMYQVGTGLVLYPFPCNVLAMYWLGTLSLVPSEQAKRWSGNERPDDKGRGQQQRLRWKSWGDPLAHSGVTTTGIYTNSNLTQGLLRELCNQIDNLR